jgi:dTDP-4-amino-4,6-dideoxygalactose transaminase
MEQIIPFNRPHITGREVHCIYDAVASGHLSGNGKYTKRCQAFFEQRYGCPKALLTTSCTDALEMCALLLDIQPGDEIIVPSYTFVSSALAFVRQGAKIIFADSRSDHPGIDEEALEELITPRTKAVVVVHYAGVACDMDMIMKVANKFGVFVVEDAAQAIESYYQQADGTRHQLGGIGHLGTFSFHETKNIQCGEGGLLAINDERFMKRAEIIWEKGTNRAEFFRGEVNKYGWVDIGSSFLASEVTAAFLWAQLEAISSIQTRRLAIWKHYKSQIEQWAGENSIRLPYIPTYATNNAHMFYLVCQSLEQRSRLIAHLKKQGVMAVFHYLSLHKSPYYHKKHIGGPMRHADHYTECLVRLPLFIDLEEQQLAKVTESLLAFK